MAKKKTTRRAGARDPSELLRALSPPMIATLVEALPGDEGSWWYEVKYDGFRALSARSAGEAALFSRNALDLGSRFPRVLDAVGDLAIDEVVLDGEIVALDESGVPRFQLLQRGAEAETVYFVFDLLWQGGEDLRPLPIEERRRRLAKIVGRRRRSVIRLAEQREGSARTALEHAAAAGHEGLIAKRRGSIYESRRSKLWLKLKAVNAQELAIVGFTPVSHSDREIGALLLGYFDEDGGLRFAGKVGTGFSSTLRRELWKELSNEAALPSPPNEAPRMKTARWVEPRLVAQVRFTEWTSDGRLRHPSFLGLRPDKSAREVVRERPARAQPAARPAGGPPKRPPRSSAAKIAARPSADRVRLTSPDRVLYPRDRITKKDLADYYEAIAEPLFRALDRRPLALEHWNSGIDQPSWFQQHVGKEAEDWMTLAETSTRTTGRTIRHFVADSPAALRWLAQHSVLTIHMWSSRIGSPESPDWLIFDLDPAKGKGFEQAIEAALVFRRLLDELRLPGVPKTSGKRGIHVLVPLVPGYSHEDAVEFACRVAEAVAARVPGLTVERSIAKRKGRLYVDCLQNGYGKTIVAPYSPRAVDRAPVSAPLEWSEIVRGLDPARFNVRTMPERLAKKGDLFRPALEGGARLPRLKGIERH
ncbi:MAG TPA: DNA ligase D [Thermoanaerobaculia bacterium]|nr:DNA ligase D [Thermoanaerobaculia bacterium]